MQRLVFINYVFIFQIYTNGYVTFDSYFNSGRPQQFSVQPGSLPDKIVAPFWSDIDMTADSYVWYHFYNQFSANSSVLYEAQTLIVQNYKDSMVASSFSPNTALVVTWENVRPAPASVYSSQVKNRLRISQIVSSDCMLIQIQICDDVPQSIIGSHFPNCKQSQKHTMLRFEKKHQ